MLARWKALAGAALLVIAGNAVADTYPNKAVRWIVPYPPGGSTDILTRLVAQKMQEAWGQPVVIENRGGASGIIGVEAAAKSPPDGYTLLMTANGPHAINPTLFESLPYDPLKSFDQITLVAKLPMLLLAHPSVPASNVKELIAWIKSQPGATSYASIGNGTPSHLAMEMFKQMADLQLTHIPYKGSGPALAAALGGQETLIMFDSVLSSSGHVKAGKLKAIAVSTAERLPTMPEVPTVSESGLAGFDAYTWTAAVAPAGVPKDRLDKISKEMVRILNLPDVREKIAGQGAIPGGNSPKELTEFVGVEIAKWGKVVKAAKVRAQ
ncbi:MAG: tripartite tricarboxylate transporter substrate binding protein [Betaproteobacteria bacterium]|nr:tripartite tricarboxylate transporter substrate binding protein [Betaproteobacteria bacterium]